MSAPARLAGFGAVLALLFGAAALAGGAVEPLREGADAAGEDEMAMDADPVRGLAVGDGELTLEPARREATPGRRFRLAFRVRDERGETVRAFEVEHEKRMHVIVVRRDMTDFQHLHPTQRPDGSWSVPLTLRRAGSYRVFADFSVDGTPHTLAADLAADGSVDWQELPEPSAVAATDGFRVRLLETPARAGAESELAFAVTRNGRPVSVQDYLGAKGHLVALREGDLAYLHVHPDSGALKFEATFPTAGRYRLFLQFRVDGRVHTAAFTKEVAR